MKKPSSPPAGEMKCKDKPDGKPQADAPDAQKKHPTSSVRLKFLLPMALFSDL